MTKKKENAKMGRPPAIDERKLRQLKDALETPMTLRLACAITRTALRTVYDTMERDPTFREELELSKAIGCKKLILLSAKQGKSWNLLKNLSDGDFKEEIRHEVGGKDGAPLTLVVKDYRAPEKPEDEDEK